MYESCAYRLVQTRQVTVYWRLKKDVSYFYSWRAGRSTYVLPDDSSNASSS
jgi:hypothetical protein